jgi:acyl-CoA thioester hydrolase
MFALWVPIEVRFRDLDALEHVNNAVYATYLETARLRYLETVGIGEPPKPTMMVARLEVDYRKSILYGQRVEVGIRVARLGTKSFSLEYEIKANGELAATGRSVQVWFDFALNQSARVPDDVRDKIRAFELQAPLER